ncbi:bifunctional (p)ppGpp synthetase/guanosine-3',5'-bis(diphosphate) 3'-pyrophosphohydrolase [Siculibacillus lacustris]|uniref:Bifunctional (P)ppGpp synthetase/guanosine-3',5'-bis(Diphosphate) 3'-pyrophosphohydrolase n=1 Tax=Siculibacillus lacustris TaxID=1549641 RepID=A0A4Q9VG32_9HYPH|nr:HD domain-containing protein [Siculibacillus lacustris]TBW33081.1 bifunctional (p)ppGpp synthetase/guanosine-3',5'-bis(diphosphate) 3'-pyrophosphohydrolase [Siculibacillus lacustris]
MPRSPTHSAAASRSATREVARLAQAAHYAARAHKFQQRKGLDAEPYVNHCLEVAELVATAEDPGDVEVVIAALLHDTVEDTAITEADLERDFGRRVADLVMAVTDDKTLPKEARKRLQIAHAPGLCRDARLVKIADKISNLRALVRTPPAGWTPERLADYVVWSQAVVTACGPTDAVLEAEFAIAHAVAAVTHPPIEAPLIRAAG